MILNVKHLKDFRQATQGIKQNTIIPACAYLLIKNNKIYKTSIDAFCSMDLDAGGEVIMLEQRVLNAFLDITKAEQINIAINKSIVISDGKRTVEHPYCDPDSFPIMPDNIEFDNWLFRPHIEAMFTAMSFCSGLDTATNLRFVHVKDNFIAAFDMFKLYYEDFEKPVPELMLLPEQVEILSQFEQLETATYGRSVFFKSGNYIFSFAKSEYSTPDLKKLRNAFDMPGINMSLDKEEIISFCNFANAINDNNETYCKLTPHGLRMEDNNFNKHINIDFSIPGEFTFSFNSKTVAPAFKAIPAGFDNCKVIQNGVQTGLCIKEKNLIACFAGLTHK